MTQNAENDAPRYRCAECGRGVSTADNLVTVNVAGHARAAHRTCPIPPERHSAFYEDHARDMQDPEYREAFEQAARVTPPS